MAQFYTDLGSIPYLAKWYNHKFESNLSDIMVSYSDLISIGVVISNDPEKADEADGYIRYEMKRFRQHFNEAMCLDGFTNSESIDEARGCISF